MNIMEFKYGSEPVVVTPTIKNNISSEPQNITPTPVVKTMVEEVKVEPKVEVKIEEPKPVEKVNTSVIKENKKIIPTEEDIMNIFIQATKEDAASIRKKWPLIKGYVGHPKYNSVVGLLSDSKPSACCHNCILIVSSEKCDAALLQSAKNIKLLQEFFTDLYGSEMDYYSITEKEFEEYKLMYLKLRQAEKLPAKKPIVRRIIELDDEVSEAEAFGKDMFGDILDIEEE